jgi:hypothetical protein
LLCRRWGSQIHYGANRWWKVQSIQQLLNGGHARVDAKEIEDQIQLLPPSLIEKRQWSSSNECSGRTISTLVFLQ